jgi:GMP synthase PP-ATPase subunit
MKGSDGKVSDALKMIVAPEIKRRIIGDTFIHVTEEVRTHTIHTIPYRTIPYVLFSL